MVDLPSPAAACFGACHDEHADVMDERDPVCGMRVDPARAAGQETYQGRTYFFCSAGCLQKFRADPARYAQDPVAESHRASTSAAPSASPSPSPSRPHSSAEAVEYTCPMHPDVRQLGPGACPICGMALEPVQPTAVADENPELADMTRRFWMSVALTGPLAAFGMGMLLP
ncbi:MAG: YHS domain-containing protein, partial [Candidatus Eiseniibacteriota bacterium]